MTAINVVSWFFLLIYFDIPYMLAKQNREKCQKIQTA